MKKSNQIYSLPIISIADGNQVGKVKSLVINPDKGSVDFLTIENEDWQVSVKAIPFKKVVGIGEYAVTVENENAVIDLNEIPIADQLVNKKIKITNTRIMTRKGELIGEATEYFVDPESGHIVGMELNTNGKTVALASEQVVTFGKEIIIVKDDAVSTFLENVEELDVPKETVEAVSDIEPLFTAEQDNTDDDEIKALKEKQIELLNGKRLKTTIYDETGKILFMSGKILERSDIELAQEAGPGVIVDLSMSVEE